MRRPRETSKMLNSVTHKEQVGDKRDQSGCNSRHRQLAGRQLHFYSNTLTHTHTQIISPGATPFMPGSEGKCAAEMPACNGSGIYMLKRAESKQLTGQCRSHR